MEWTMDRLIEKSHQMTALKLSKRTPVYKRFIFDDVKKSPAKIVGLYGARGVGKTTLMTQLLKELDLLPSECLFISCDHPLFTNISLYDFAESFYKRGGKILFIDEVHKIEGFQEELKAIYDFLELKVIFSGSSALAITNPDFIRRFSMFYLPILSLREYVRIAYDLDIDSFELKELLDEHERLAIEIIKKLPDKILKIFNFYLEKAAYPFYFEDPEKYIDKLTDTINASLYYDIAEIYNIPTDKMHSLKKLLTTICTSKPLELSIENLSNTIGITKTTLYKYLEYLSRADLLIHIHHEAKRFKSIRKPDKLYLANTNLLTALCMEKEIGTIRETFFASMLKYKYKLNYLDHGDFLVDEKYVFEIGGQSKDFSQIKSIKESYIAADNIEIGFGNKIPLWLFGFLY